jgi:hypothetical protein
MRERKGFVLVATIVTSLTAASIPAEAQIFFRQLPRAFNYLSSRPGPSIFYSPSIAPYNRAHTTQGLSSPFCKDPV